MQVVKIEASETAQTIFTARINAQDEIKARIQSAFGPEQNMTRLSRLMIEYAEASRAHRILAASGARRQVEVNLGGFHRTFTM